MAATKLDMNEIGEQVFGLRTSMTYRCIQKYKESIGEPTIKKPRKQGQSFEPNVCRDLMTRLSKLIDTTSPSKALFAANGRSNIEEDLKLISDMKAQLRLLEKQLSENHARNNAPKKNVFF